MANMRQDALGGEEAERITETLPVTAIARISERAWWAVDL